MMIQMRALDTVRTLAETLCRAGIEHPDREAELIVAHCLGKTRLALFRDDPEVDDTAVSMIKRLIERRIRREPIQYILGATDFHGLRIRVGSGVLIPRPETELLVEEAIAWITRRAPYHSHLTILDLCTGSGCIALALARTFPDASVWGIDTSETAIRYAIENARLNGISNAIFLQGSLFDPFQEILRARPAEISFDLLISNPPYVKTSELSQLEPEIRDWEPVEALDGGRDGLDIFRRILDEAKGFVKERGILMFEVGIGQSDAVVDIARRAGFAHAAVKKDYSGVDRIVTIWD